VRARIALVVGALVPIVTILILQTASFNVNELASSLFARIRCAVVQVIALAITLAWTTMFNRRVNALVVDTIIAGTSVHIVAIAILHTAIGNEHVTANSIRPTDVASTHVVVRAFAISMAAMFLVDKLALMGLWIACINGTDVVVVTLIAVGTAIVNGRKLASIVITPISGAHIVVVAFFVQCTTRRIVDVFALFGYHVTSVEGALIFVVTITVEHAAVFNFRKQALMKETYAFFAFLIRMAIGVVGTAVFNLCE